MINLHLIEEESTSQLLEATQMGDLYKFLAVLQTGDTLNNNRRVYPTSLLSEEVMNLRPRAQRSELLGELDHPFLTVKDPEIVMKREYIVMYDRASHKITDLRMEGNKVMGNLETLKTDKGKTLAGLIASNVPVGFSLRAFGKLRVKPDGTFVVEKPFKVVTWDAVSNPSHTDARLVEITESTIKETIYQTALLEGVAMNRIDALIGLVDDYSFLESTMLMEMIRKHFDILYSLAGANLKEI